jgi:hypothetical protein
MTTLGSRPSGDLREEVSRLVDEQRALEAIPLLTAANRAHPDPETEHLLLAVRHAAFEELRPSPPSTWPPEVEDLFAGTVGIPEVTADELTAEHLASGILHHGSLIVRNLLTVDECAVLRDDIDAAFAGCEAWEEGAKTAETLPHFARFNPGPGYTLGKAGSWVRKGGGLYAVEAPRTVFDLLEALERCGIGDTLTGYLGERPCLSVKKWTLRRVPVDSGTNWHQDGAFLGEVRTVNLWLALSDCGVTSPTVDVVARRLDRLVETGTGDAFFDWSVGQDAVDAARGDAPIVRPTFAAGDALLFDDLNLHRTATSPEMTEPRYAIESWFFAPSSYPTAQVPIVF